MLSKFSYAPPNMHPENSLLQTLEFFVEFGALWIFVVTKAFPANYRVGKGESVVHEQKK